MPQGVIDRDLRLMAECGNGSHNESRNLHCLIHRQGRTLPVQVNTVPTRVRILRGKPKVSTTNFPVLYLSEWSKTLFSLGGKLLLGGFTLDDEAGFRQMFRQFWQDFKHVRPDLDLYTRDDIDYSMCIPVGYHGDEGRGKLRRPVMILSYQFLIGHKGPDFSNMSGNPGSKMVFFLAI